MPIEGAKERNLLRLLRLPIEMLSELELLALHRRVFEVSHEPGVRNLVLLPLPALDEVCGPEDDTDGIDRIERRVECICPHLKLGVCHTVIDLHDEEDDADNRGDNEHAGVVDKPGEVHGKL